MKLAGAMTTATSVPMLCRMLYCSDDSNATLFDFQSLSSMNKVMNPAQLGKTMQEFEKASTKMDMTEEMMNDVLDDILNESGDEEEGESIVQQVLDEIGIDISSKVFENVMNLSLPLLNFN